MLPGKSVSLFYYSICRSIIAQHDETKFEYFYFYFSILCIGSVSRLLSGHYGIATRRGAFCANPYVWRLYGLTDEQVHNFAECSDVNTPGMIRVSFGIYNTEEEVDYLLKVLPEAVKEAKETNKENFGLAEPAY